MDDDFIPDNEFVPDSASPPAPQPKQAPPKSVTPQAAQGADPDFIPDDSFVPDEEKFGSHGQTALALGEKFAQGIAGPLAPMAEIATGLTTPENIRLRGETAGGLGTVAEMAGFGAGAFFGTGEAALLSKLGKGVEAVSGLSKATGLGGKIAAGAVRGAAELAALQVGEETTKHILKDPHQTAGSAAVNVGLSTVLGGAFGGGFGAISPLWNATAGPTVERILGKIKADWGLGEGLAQEEHIVSPLIKNALSIFGGVSKENIESYAANREAIMAAPEFHDVYSNVLEQLTEMQENLDVKKTSVRDAQAKFSEFLKEQKLALKQAGYDAGAANTLANQALKEAQDRLTIGLQQGAIESAPRAFSAVEKLRSQAMEMSQGARNILDETPGALSLKPIFQAIRPMQDKLYSQGFPHMAEELGKTMDVFAHQYGEEIGFSDAKSMIQGLQQRGKWDSAANEISSGLRPYFNQLSGIMNEALKEAVPAYRAAMKPTAEAFEMLGKLDKYASPEAAVKGALALKSPANYANEMPLLKSLEEKSGISFTHQLEHYANPSVRDAMTKALPEYAQSLRAAEALEALKDPATRAALEKAPYLSQSYKALTKAEKMLQAGVERKQGLNGLSPATLEGKMKSIMAGRGLNAKRAFEGIRGFEDMSIPEVLHLIAVREAFEKGAMNGSRNVNLFSKMFAGVGGLAGGLLGHSVEGGILGAGAGGVLGGAVDKEGPAMVREFLDKYLDKYGDLPKAVGASPESTRVGLAHFLSSDKHPDAKAFKSTVNYINAARGGGKLLKNGAKSIFEGGKVLPQNLFPEPDKTKKLNDRAKDLQGNQQRMMDIGSGVGTYMPEHGQALSQSAMRAVDAINQYRPATQKGAFLDAEVKPTREQESDYEHGLQIAQQPLMVLHHMKENSLLPQDMQILNALHPEYANHMRQEVAHAMADFVSGGGTVPYSLRQGLSLFLGQDLDSSFSPKNIIAAQMVFAQQRAAQQGAGGNGPNRPANKTAGNKLGKAGEQHKTAEQAAQERKSQPA